LKFLIYLTILDLNNHFIFINFIDDFLKIVIILFFLRINFIVIYDHVDLLKLFIFHLTFNKIRYYIPHISSFEFLKDLFI
jgi:hypothetical protein